MATFLIAPGGGLGAWAYRDVVEFLRDRGHFVFAATYTGTGERSHLLSRDVDLSTHVQDVVAVMECEDLRDVVLVGHSYGGVVITGVAERVAERLSHLVYLDAVVPLDGESHNDVLGPEWAHAAQESVRERGDGWLLPAPVSDPPYSPLPWSVLTQPLELREPQATAVRRAYIRCTLSTFSSDLERRALDKCGQRIRQMGGDYHELAADHCPNWSAPRELADLLDALA